MTRSILSLFTLFLLMTSCLSPTDIVEKQDEDLIQLKELMLSQPISLSDKKVVKTVNIEELTEELTLTIDSIFVAKEFKEINNLDIIAVFQNGGYLKESTPIQVQYTRKASEKSGPLLLTINKLGDQISDVTLQLETDNLIYHSTFQLNLSFDPITSTVTQYDIATTQKVIGLDPSTYQVEGIIQ